MIVEPAVATRGFFVFAPFLQQTLQPFLIATFGHVPVLSMLFEGPPYGIGVLTAGLVLAIMVLPFITSVTRDVFESVPAVLKEAAYGMGATTWEVVRHVVLPYARVGVIGAMEFTMEGYDRSIDTEKDTSCGHALHSYSGSSHCHAPAVAIPPATTVVRRCHLRFSRHHRGIWYSVRG